MNLQIATSLHTPAGNKVDPSLNVAGALRKAAQLLRQGSARELYGALCLSGASAGVRFHALGALRFVALGTREGGNLTGHIKGMSGAQLAELCARAAEVA